MPIKVCPKEVAEFIKEGDWQDNYQKINPFEISSYRPAEWLQSECTSVYFKDGDDLLVMLTIQQFEELLNKHYT